MSYAQFVLTKLKKVARRDKKTQNRPQVRFGRFPKATYRLEDISHVINSGLTLTVTQGIWYLLLEFGSRVLAKSVRNRATSAASLSTCELRV